MANGSAPIPSGHITRVSQAQEAETTPVMPAASVLGTLVSGLTNCDLHRLDIFEGSEYVREKVKVRILRETLLGGDETEPEPEPETGHTGASVNANRNMESNGGGGDSEEHLREVLEAARAEFADEAEEVDAVTYVWVAGRDRLEDAEWDFEAFKRDKMAGWVNADERDW
ncbi:hypothetical protein ARAM_000828 [Aspergillus rambellii]|uniref:Uncharacterized protein n=1 Tax=Aspergillus rambellii TaxID=308745 RepID=A0A0F8U1V4_9EURO|nr:hypothetical protein ARAM_000828 [Aspergillus rambellii]